MTILPKSPITEMKSVTFLYFYISVNSIFTFSIGLFYYYFIKWVTHKHRAHKLRCWDKEYVICSYFKTQKFIQICSLNRDEFIKAECFKICLALFVRYHW